MGAAGSAFQGLGSIVSAVGDLSAGASQAQSAKYNASVALINSQQAKRNADIVSEAGSAQAAIQSRRTGAEVSGIKANTAAGGVDVNSGSAVDTRVSEQEVGKLDALTVRSNATKEAYGYQTQAVGFQNEATLDKFEASSDLTAGYMKGAGTLLSGGGGAASSWEQYQQAGALATGE